jgi:hypothetical protein
MNKQIRELVKQAGFGVRQNGSEVYTSKLEHLPITENVEKFAELIVRECAIWMENVTVTDSSGNKDYIGDSFFWADELKKHFGVE